MKAAILENKGLLTYSPDVPTPTMKPGHVLLQVKAVSICGSDISRYAKGHRMYPLILGHECAGVIPWATATRPVRLSARLAPDRDP